MAIMMEQRPFEISIFVAQGRPDGLRVIQKSNWVGQGVVVPRSGFREVRYREEFQRRGVYLLVGEDDDGGRQIYIGKCDVVRNRIDSHMQGKDFWQELIFFTRKGDDLNQSEVSYLESKLIELASKARRSTLENSTQPSLPSLSEVDRAIADGFLEEMLSLLPILSVDDFEVPDSTQSPLERNDYFLKGSEWDAVGWEQGSKFVVAKGSIFRKDFVPSVTYERDQRKKLIESGVLADSDDGWVLTGDFAFSSPSKAGTLVTGRSTNGRTAWIDSRGRTLKQNQEAAL